MADSVVGAIRNGVRDTAARFGRWLDTPQGRGVVKCTIAYTIASLATFAPPLSNFLGKPEGKHVVATITVYFHPARSAGSMIEAILVATVAVAYAEVISLLSMATSVFFGSTMKLVTLSHILVVVIFIGGGFGFMGWAKQTMSSPLVNVGSTLASLAIISVVTKEDHVLSNVFSNEKVSQVFKMLVMGTATTALVNLLIWPSSARGSLRETMKESSASLGDMLLSVTESFLGGCEDSQAPDDLSVASSAHSAACSQMTKDLGEAKFEHYFLGHEAVYDHELSVTRSLETLAQALGGLRNAANAQLRLLKAPKPSGQTIAEDAHIATPSDLFRMFNASVGSSMSLLQQTLYGLLHEPPFGGPPNYEVNIDEDLRRSLMDSLSSFSTARTDALQELYNRIELVGSAENARADLEEVAAACGYFSFSFQAFGEEVLKYLDILDDLEYTIVHKSRSWRWLLWWKDGDGEGRDRAIRLFETPEADALIRSRQRRASPPGDSHVVADLGNAGTWHSAPNANRVLAWIWREISKLFRKMAQDEIQFGLKVGIGAALWAMLAFVEETRDVYAQWRGEWGLLSFMIVCSMTVGAANTTGWARFIGTLFGAMFSVINWKLSHGYALALVALGWLTSFWNFYLIVALGRAPLGRISLLAYNVSTLHAYSLQRKTGEGGTSPDILEVAKHRTIAVTAGIIWGMVVCRVIWPISARRKFKESLSLLHLQMGLVWKRGPLAVLFRSEGAQSYLKSGEQIAMQRYAANLESLRQSAASEFELRGPFPMGVYGRVLQGTRRILDGFYGMRLVAYRKGYLTEGERALLQYTARERAALCDHICHAFQVVASSAMLEYPLTDATPSILAARENLLNKIFQFRKENPSTSELAEGSRGGESADILVEEKDYALLYAYALVTGQVADELRMVGKEMGSLFGMLNEDSRLLR